MSPLILSAGMLCGVDIANSQTYSCGKHVSLNKSQQSKVYTISAPVTSVLPQITRKTVGVPLQQRRILLKF